MSGKKELNEMDEDLSESDSDSSMDEDNEEDGRHPDAYKGNEEVQVDFEGRIPIDPDCDGIAQLLSRLFLKAHINCMEMAKLIIAQNFVGSVISLAAPENCADEPDDDDLCEDDAIFGITTVVNMTAKKDKPCIEQLRSYIIQRAEKNATDAVLTHFRDAFTNETRHVGFLINERFINIPSQISVPLLENLQKEINASKAKGMKFDFAYFLMIIKLYRKKARKGKPAEDLYTNAEEEIICEKAVNSFEFAVTDECDMGLAGDWMENDPLLTPYRKVLLFDAKLLPQLIDDVKKFIAGE